MNIFNLIRGKTGSASVTINGKTYVGNNIAINANGIVSIDGVAQNGAALVGPITVNVVGDIQEVNNTSGNINVSGNAKHVMSTSGDINVTGDITGNASSTAGDIKCSAIHGDASTISGDISRKFLR